MKIITAEFGEVIAPPQKRHWWDFAIRENGVLYPVNIKVTEMSPAADNLNCKLGLYYALTGKEPNFANEIRWREFFSNLSDDMSENDRDYYFLVFNKSEPGEVVLANLKGLRTLQPNGNNLPFQCCWKDNRQIKERSFAEAQNFLLECLGESAKLRAQIYLEFKETFPNYSPK